MTQHMNPHMTMYPSGRNVNMLDLREEDIDLRDIAHHLALCNRYAGGTPYPLSVAQHSTYVSLIVPKEHALQGLLHDAAEAYLGDVTKWLKGTPEMAAYREAEDRALTVIMETFGCSPVLSQEVDDADHQMCAFEMFSFKKKWSTLPRYGKPPDDVLFRIGDWRPITWDRAEEAFLAQFRYLMLR